MTDKRQDETIKNQIIALLGKGYKRDQLIKDFKFAERSVDAAIKAYKELHNGNAGEPKEDDRPIADDGASAPPSNSGGKGATQTSGRDGVLAIRKEKESVLPEWLEADVAEIFDGQARDQRIFLAGMSVPLMGLRLFTEGVKPIIDLLATWQKGQAEAASAAQGSGIEMAKAAGEAAAMGVGKYFEETKPWLAASPDPWRAMMFDTIRPFFQQMVGQLMGGFMRFTPQGQVGVQPPSPSGQPGQADFRNTQPGQPGFQQSGRVQQASDDEVKEAFGDY